MPTNFNYISLWDHRLVEATNGVQMDRRRMFEYTPTDIDRRLEDLNSSALIFLDSLPTFLCSEMFESDDHKSMLVKYGRIKNTHVDQNVVSTTFEEISDFGKVQFQYENQAREVFGAERLQPYRTHWAVREGDINDILQRLKELSPLHDTLIVDQIVSPPEPAVLPPREKTVVGKADSVEAFLKLLYGLPTTTTHETFYRGHSDGDFELTPSLLRKTETGAWQFLPNEDRLCKELLIAHYDEFQGDQYCFDRLVRMQHFGLPTRLLDISSNPLMALFFACEYDEADPVTEGEVIVFRVVSETVKYYDSDTVSCISNLSNLTYDQKDKIDLNQSAEHFNVSDVPLKLLHHIKSEKGYFEGRIVPADLGSIVCVKAKRNNSRIKSQSGAFLLFGHEAKLPDNGQYSIDVFRITITNKAEILKQLDSINVNSTTVYPSIDQTAVHLRARYLKVSSV